MLKMATFGLRTQSGPF